MQDRGLSSAAELFVFSLSSGSNSTAISSMETLCAQFTPLCHPSNSGTWSQPLTSFVTTMAEALAKRVSKGPISPTRSLLNTNLFIERKKNLVLLDKEPRESLVALLWPLVHALCFAKAPMRARAGSVALSQLASTFFDILL